MLLEEHVFGRMHRKATDNTTAQEENDELANHQCSSFTSDEWLLTTGERRLHW